MKISLKEKCPDPSKWQKKASIPQIKQKHTTLVQMPRSHPNPPHGAQQSKQVHPRWTHLREAHDKWRVAMRKAKAKKDKSYARKSLRQSQIDWTSFSRNALQ